MNATDRLICVCKALSSPTRVRILQLLGSRTLCVNALAAHLGVTQGCVSQHLRILRDSGLLEAEKRGYYVHYGVNAAALKECTAALATIAAPPAKRKIRCELSSNMERKLPCAVKKPSVRSRKS